MNLRLKIAISAILFTLIGGVFVVALPSLIGILLTGLILLAIYDLYQKRRRNAARTFNSAIRAVCHRQGAVSKVVTAFARQGPLRGPCYEYARRLMVGQDPVRAAGDSHVPLQLATAVAMRTVRPNEKYGLNKPARSSWPVAQTDSLPAYVLIFYVTLTALITCAVLSFVTVFILPTIEQMFEEFGATMEPYEWLLVGTTPTWILLALLAAMMLLLLPILIRNERFAIPALDWLPMSPQAAESRADMLDGLADAIESGMPFSSAIDLACEISIKPNESASLQKAAISIQRGASAADSLYQNGWVDGDEFSWLRDAPMHRFAQLLRHFGDQGVRDARANLQWLMGILFPAFIVLLGLAVLSYTYGFLGTLMKLIGILS